MGFVFTWKKLSIRYGIRFFFLFLPYVFLNLGYYIDNGGFRSFRTVGNKILTISRKQVLFKKKKPCLPDSIYSDSGLSEFGVDHF